MRLRGAKRALGTRMVQKLLAALGVGSTDFQPFCEPAFLDPYLDRWEEDKQPHSHLEMEPTLGVVMVS